MSRFDFMQRQQNKYYLAEMGEAFGVSRSGYYRWAEAKPSARREQDELINPVIEQVVRLAHGPLWLPGRFTSICASRVWTAAGTTPCA